MRVMAGFTAGVAVSVVVSRCWRVFLGWVLSRGD